MCSQKLAMAAIMAPHMTEAIGEGASAQGPGKNRSCGGQGRDPETVHRHPSPFPIGLADILLLCDTGEVQ